MSVPYKSSNQYNRMVFTEGTWAELFQSLQEWSNEEVMAKPTKPKIIHTREFYILDVIIYFDGDNHVANVYYSKDMPQ